MRLAAVVRMGRMVVRLVHTLLHKLADNIVFVFSGDNAPQAQKLLLGGTGVQSAVQFSTANVLFTIHVVSHCPLEFLLLLLGHFQQRTLRALNASPLHLKALLTDDARGVGSIGPAQITDDLHQALLGKHRSGHLFIMFPEDSVQLLGYP